MSAWRRYAIFVVPKAEFYRTGAEWLGWNSVTGTPLVQPSLEGLPKPAAEITRTPRKYGFHGTLKPPFRLTAGETEASLHEALRNLCQDLAPVTLSRLAVRRLGGFVAIMPENPTPDLRDLAARVVEGIDRFRAPLTQTEMDRRRKGTLSERQDELLQLWGYPFVMEEFRFHLTLTGGLGRAVNPVAERLAEHFGPVLPSPVAIDSLCLMGEAEDGMFHLLSRVPLSA